MAYSEAKITSHDHYRSLSDMLRLNIDTALVPTQPRASVLKPSRCLLAPNPHIIPPRLGDDRPVFLYMIEPKGQC